MGGAQARAENEGQGFLLSLYAEQMEEILRERSGERSRRELLGACARNANSVLSPRFAGTGDTCGDTLRIHTAISTLLEISSSEPAGNGVLIPRPARHNKTARLNPISSLRLLMLSVLS
jgi:hypothetical protein